MKAVVVGAGMIGSSVAYRLTEAGVDVTIVEAGRVGGGTSGTSFAWLNSNNKPPRAYHDLNVAGMNAHKNLKKRFGKTPWLHESGNLEWRHDPAAREVQRKKVEQLQSWGYAAEWVSKARLGELEPDIDLGAVGDATIAYFPDEGWLDPVLYAAAMIRAAIDRGAKLKCGAKVSAYDRRGDKVVGVRLTDGTQIASDIVVNCTGRWVNDVTSDVAFHIPMDSTVGFLVFTPPVGCTLQRPVHTDDISVRPDGAGRLMVRRDDLDRAVTMDTVASPALVPAREAVGRAARILPALAGVEPEAARITMRPTPGDGHSAVGTIPNIDGYYMVITHSGVTLGAFFGEAVADEIARGKTRPELQPFRPGRFHNQGVRPSVS